MDIYDQEIERIVAHGKVTLDDWSYSNQHSPLFDGLDESRRSSFCPTVTMNHRESRFLLGFLGKEVLDSVIKADIPDSYKKIVATRECLSKFAELQRLADRVHSRIVPAIVALLLMCSVVYGQALQPEPASPPRPITQEELEILRKMPTILPQSLVHNNVSIPVDSLDPAKRREHIRRFTDEAIIRHKRILKEIDSVSKLIDVINALIDLDDCEKREHTDSTLPGPV